MVLIHRRKAPWSAAELEKLLDLVGEMPLSMAHRAFSTWARAHGYPPRSLSALKHKAQKQVESIVPVGTWLQVSDVARFAGTTSNRVFHWIRRGWVRASRYPDQRWGYHYVRRNSLRGCARAHPQAFGGATRDGLYALLENHKLVDWVLATNASCRRLDRRPRPVVKLSTGELYQSMTKAAVAHSTASWRIHRSANSSGRYLVAGSAWAYAS